MLSTVSKVFYVEILWMKYPYSAVSNIPVFFDSFEADFRLIA